MEAPLVPPDEQPAPAGNKLATASGLLGLGSVFVCLLGLLVNFLLPGSLPVFCAIGMLASLVGLAPGIIALAQIRKNPAQKGKELAVIGVIFGGTAAILLFLLLVVAISALVFLGPTIGNVLFKATSTPIAP